MRDIPLFGRCKQPQQALTIGRFFLLKTMDELQEQQGSVVFYQSEDGTTKLSARLVNDNIWLTQKAMGELFGCSSDNIGVHLKNIFNSGELQESSVTEKISATAADGKNYLTNFYNLDAIISVGYRVNSKRATQFRIWATSILKEYVIKGFALDDERLKNPNGLADHFDELLQRIKDIRTSELRFYQKLRELFALSSTDYDKSKEYANVFFAEIQNKLLYAVTGMTAAELVVARANENDPNMGLTSWKGSRVRKEDIYIAKNYLTQEELEQLNSFVVLFLDSAEMRVQDKKELTLDFWRDFTKRLLEFHEKEVLSNAGKISNESMKKIVSKIYSDFDKRRKRIEAEETDRFEEQELKALEAKIRKKSN